MSLRILRVTWIPCDEGSEVLYAELLVPPLPERPGEGLTQSLFHGRLVGLHEHAEKRLVPAVRVKGRVVRHGRCGIPDETEVCGKALPFGDKTSARFVVLDDVVRGQELGAHSVAHGHVEALEDVALGELLLRPFQGIGQDVVVAEPPGDFPELRHIAKLRAAIQVHEEVAVLHHLAHQLLGQRSLPEPEAVAGLMLHVLGPPPVVLDEVREAPVGHHLVEEARGARLVREALLGDIEAVAGAKAQQVDVRPVFLALPERISAESGQQESDRSKSALHSACKRGVVR
mmetsp:Transcript_7429/g.20877  ORF Transcript_7429/g.20877 Transcript_7429/m.20877 type:complete len:287 (+) Transcript_7429:206-1066(+)